MIILDTDHLRVLQDGGAPAERLKNRLMKCGMDVGTTIISFEENVDGKIGQLKKLPVEKQVAICTNTIVLTANRRHFDLVEGLTAEDWVHRDDGSAPDIDVVL